jgi:microcystin degradation protein MlrC
VERVAGRVRPAAALAKAGCVLTSFNMRTTDGPMAELAALARQCEQRPGVLDATIFGGFAYGDTPTAGAAALVTTDGDPKGAAALAEELADAIRQRRDRFDVSLPSPAEGLRRALAAPAGTVAVLDPADNVLSGGAADTPGLLRTLLETSPDLPCVFAFFWDPQIVAAAHAAGPEATIRCRLGGRLSPLFGPPVAAEARVLRLTEGRFVNQGPMEANLPVELGRTALLRIGAVRVIVTEHCKPANDRAYFELHGIELPAMRLLCVKAKNHFRAAFAPLCSAIVEVDAPGPASPDLSRYPFRHVPAALLPVRRGAAASA